MSYVRLEPFLPNPDYEIGEQSAESVLAMTLWGEARGGTIEAKAAVASVIMRRAEAPAGRFFPKAHDGAGLNERVKRVCLQPWQFSCFNSEDPNRAKLLSPERHDSLQVWQECIAVAALALDGLMRDPTRGADHYFSPAYATSESGVLTIKNRPKWAEGRTPTLTLRGFMFYKIG